MPLEVLNPQKAHCSNFEYRTRTGILSRYSLTQQASQMGWFHESVIPAARIRPEAGIGDSLALTGPDQWLDATNDGHGDVMVGGRRVDVPVVPMLAPERHRGGLGLFNQIHDEILSC